MAAPAGEHASSTARTDDSACHPTVSSAKSGTPTLFERLGRPRHVMAPMVHGSELPFRMLCRRYGCQLCYTPMWNAALVRDDPEYAAFVIKDASCPDDRPLIMQFQASSGKDLLAAAEIVAPYVDAVDLNLGCPQTCAQKGGYGASLMDNLPKVARIVKTAAKKSPVPITAKIRVFRDDEQATVAYARLLEQAGAQMLTVHGRGREDREAHQLANWDLIRAVKRAVRIPVLANGNILYYPDIPRCLKHTGCDGVMVANALLWDPRLFTNPALPLVTGHLFDMCAPADALGVALAKEYLECVRQHPTEYLYVLHHIKRLLYNCAHYHPEMIVRLLQLQVNIVGDQSAPTSQTLIQKLEPLLDTLESQVLSGHVLSFCCLKRPRPAPSLVTLSAAVGHPSTTVRYSLPAVGYPRTAAFGCASSAVQLRTEIVSGLLDGPSFLFIQQHRAGEGQPSAGPEEGPQPQDAGVARAAAAVVGGHGAVQGHAVGRAQGTRGRHRAAAAPGGHNRGGDPAAEGPEGRRM